MAVISPPILKLLSDLDIDLMDIDNDMDYLRALMEATNALTISNPGDKRIPILQKEVKRVRDNRKAKSKITKKTISTSKLLNRKSKGDVGEKGMESNTGKLARILRDTRGNEKRLDNLKLGENQQEGGDLLVIKEKVVSIESLLGEQYKLQEDNAKDAKKEAEKKRRSLKERLLEGTGKIWDGVKKATSKILNPFKKVWENIIGFIGKIILGRVLFNILNWVGDKNNQGKVKSIIRFFEDWWPAMLAAYLLFGNAFTSFAATFVAKAVWWGAKLLLTVIPALAKALVGMGKWGIVAAGVMGVGGYLMMRGDEDNEESGVPSVTPRGDRTELENQKFDEMSEAKGFKQGGFVSGPAGVDKVPAKLTAGEFVMSKGAVQKYGTNTLAAMNAAGGGTNRPTFSRGRGRYNTGGDVTGMSKGGFSMSMIQATPEQRHASYADMGIPSMELSDGSVVPDFGKMGADQFTEALATTREMMVGNNADPSKIAKLDELMVMPQANPEFIQNTINRIVPGSTAQVLGDESDTINFNVKNDKQFNGGGLVQNFQGGGLVQNNEGGNSVSNLIQNFQGGGQVRLGGRSGAKNRANIAPRKTAPVITPSVKKNITVAYTENGGSMKSSDNKLPPQTNKELPSFSATAMRDIDKINLLGISV